MANWFLTRVARPFNEEGIVSSTNGARQLHIHMQKNAIGPHIPYININSIWIKDLIVTESFLEKIISF